MPNYRCPPPGPLGLVCNVIAAALDRTLVVYRFRKAAGPQHVQSTDYVGLLRLKMDPNLVAHKIVVR
jgi:hypothetical protein